MSYKQIYLRYTSNQNYNHCYKIKLKLVIILLKLHNNQKYFNRLQAGCPTTIEIPTTDPDGDRVRCRFSETADECGDVCQHFPFFTFIEVCLS